MSEDIQWLLRPVTNHLCFYESLLDGSLDLVDVARMNEALDVDEENRARIEEALAPKR